jgi:C6 transcription factor Pro1
MWWSNNEQRRAQKEHIKNIIKCTKLQEKNAHAVPLPPTNTPPSLYHSPSDGMSRTRGGSMDSTFSGELDFNQLPATDFFGAAMMPPPQHPGFAAGPGFSPFEVDVKTQRQVFVNDVETRRDSTISTFSTYQVPPSPGQSMENWVQKDYFEHRQEQFVEEPLDFNFFDFPHGAMTPTHQTLIQVEEGDQYLLNHFIDHVLRLIFPILEVNQHGSARSEVILPALESNKAYLHCCLSIAALHLKTTQNIQDKKLDDDITRHKFATITELCQALNSNTDHERVLEAALGMIFFRSSVGKPSDNEPDVPWHAHFTAATDIVSKLELPAQLADSQVRPPFNMTVAAWIDILGATMLGRTPNFAHTYREMNIADSSMGLAELMGCDDKIMFLISEIACLEALKAEGMDDIQLCMHIKILGERISMTEAADEAVGNAYSATGAIRPKQLSKNMTAVFRIAARIYLCSLLPDFDRHQPNIINLVSRLAEAMDFIPAGPDGFDRSLTWPLLIAGAASLPGCSFRAKLAERVAQMGEVADFGSLGRAKELLAEVWRANDEAALRGERQSVHWRDAMHQRGWDFLLI